MKRTLLVSSRGKATPVFSATISATSRKSISSFSFRASSGGPSSRLKKVVLLGSVVALPGILVVLAEEKTTEKEEQHTPTALSPAESSTSRKRVVVLGTGWAALSFVREIDTSLYDVVVISPRNYFLFTPLLPSVTVGTLEPRSVIEPIRHYCRRTQKGGSIEFFEAACKAIDAKNKRVLCDTDGGLSNVKSFNLDYDQLVVAVGSQNVTFNTPGADKHCFFLKELPDAVAIRNRVLDVLETANLPGQSEAEKKRLLSFAVVGGGPTGVEFAAELHDFLEEDLRKHYSADLLKYFTITVVQSADTILNTYDAHISHYAQQEFARQKIDVKTLARVTEVTPTSVTYFSKTSNKSETIPCGLCVWAAGIGPVPVVSDFIKSLPPGSQNNAKAIVTDGHLKVKGSSDIYAIGDCSTIDQEKLLAKFSELFDEADVNKDGKLSLEEIEAMITKNQKIYPQMRIYANHGQDLLAKGDTNKDGELDRQEFEKLMRQVDSEILPLPTTAQVAAQQGKYLGRAFNSRMTGQAVEAFKYEHLGSFAYIGNKESVLELPGNWQFGGFVAWWMWRTTYLSKQISMRNKMMVAFDWSKELIAGRDVSRF